MDHQGKTREELLRDFQKLQKKYDYLVELCNKDREERELTELTLRENEANIKAIIENSLESIWSIDTNYIVQYVNEVFAKSFEQSFGVQLSIGINLLDALPHPLRNVWKERYDRAFKNEHFVFTDKIDMDDAAIYIEVAMNPIVVDGKVVGASFYGRDISESKNAELQLIAAKEKAEESDRLKLAFLANMSHEIRTPMNGILGFADLLKDPDLSGEKQLDFIRIIEKSGVRMLTIINDLINISKIESGQIEISNSETNLNEQLDFMFKFFKSETAQKNLQFAVEFPKPANAVIINSDKEKIYAILTNLIKNAIKFTDRGSIDFGYTLKGEKFEFFVRDTGKGIPKDKQQAIFERFIQADSSISSGHEGAGLGLSISRAYVELLGGELWVESEEGKGSIFYFTLPVNEVSKNELATKEKQESEPYFSIKAKNATILIAEDDETSSIYLRSILEGLNIKLLEAKTGKEALAACNNNEDIILVLMDIKMPVMDGHTAAKEIKKIRPNLPIIAQTAFVLETERMKYIDIFDDYLTKPLKADTLKQKVISYLEKV